MKQPPSEVKQEILTKLMTFIRQLTNEFLNKQLTPEDTNGKVGLYIFELQKTYGPDAVLCVTRELNENLSQTTFFPN